MTLIQVTNKIKSLLASYRLINSLYLGEVSAWAELEGMVYTNALLVYNDAYPQGGEYTVNYTLYLSDLLEEGNLNELEIYSDTLQIANDFLSDLADGNNYDWIATLLSPITPFSDTRGNDNRDRVAGHKVDFSIRAISGRDCAKVIRRRAILTEGGLMILTEAGEIIEPETDTQERVVEEGGYFGFTDETTGDLVNAEG